MGNGKGLSTREAGRGHATPHKPVEMAKCWWLLKIEPSLFLKPAQTPSKMGPKPLLSYITHQRTREFLQLEGQRRLHSCLCHLPTPLVLFLVITSILLSVSTGICGVACPLPASRVDKPLVMVIPHACMRKVPAGGYFNLLSL